MLGSPQNENAESREVEETMWKPLPSAVALAMLAATASAAEPTGTWLSQSAETKVRIAPCGFEFCGTIVWVKSDTNDVNNPSLRGRSLGWDPHDLRHEAVGRRLFRQALQFC